MLAEKLHKTQAEILEMGADEFYNWMSFLMLKDDKYKQKIEKSRSGEMDDEERSNAIKAMFQSIVTKG